MTVEEEGELICEKLLGWKRDETHPRRMWLTPDVFHKDTPSFTTGDDAWLILKQFERIGCDWDIERTETDAGFKTTVRVFTHRSNICIRNVADVAGAIRAAALEYVKAVAEWNKRSGS